MNFWRWWGLVLAVVVVAVFIAIRDIHGMGVLFVGLMVGFVGFFVGMLIEPYAGLIRCVLTGHAVQWGPCPRCGRRAKG